MGEYYKDIDEFMDKSGYSIDDEWYPRVTKIVSIKAKPALYRFYGSLKNYEEGKKITEKSAEEGTLLHEAAEAIFLGKEPNIPESIAPAIEAFDRFRKKHNIRVSPEYVERRVMHTEERYAGTVDSVAYIDGKMGVLDIKTSKGIYRDYNLQTAAYVEAIRRYLPSIETRWILRVDQSSVCESCGSKRRVKGGRESVKETAKSCPGGEHFWAPTEGVVELKEFPYWHHDYNAFLSAKRLWEWENIFWLKKVGYL